MTKMQKWVHLMRSTDPGPVVPTPTEADTNKVLVTGSDCALSWGTVQGGDTPLPDDEGFLIYKEP